MDATSPGPWLALIGLGAYHGINPAMGWLFAVALGLQEKRRSAILRALPLIALGHEAAIALVVLVVDGARLIAAPDILRLAGAGALVMFGLYKFAKPRSHPRWVGMRVSGPELVLWSFLMSSAHGAGLMLFPVLLGLPGEAHAHPPLALTGATLLQDLAAVVLHTASMLVVMGAVALLVYERLGLNVLRRAWLNLDRVWAGAVLMAGVATLVT